MRMFSLIALCFGLLCLNGPLRAQMTTFPVQGIPDPREDAWALKNATIHLPGGQTLSPGTLVIRKGRIQAVGANPVIPTDAAVLDLTGRHLYPGLIDLSSDYGLASADPASRQQRPNQEEEEEEEEDHWISNRPGPYAWNDALKTDFRAAEAFQPDTKAADRYRKAGFTSVLTHRKDGLSAGLSALVALSDEPAGIALRRADVGHHLSFRKGTSAMAYPGSLMGCIALFRQTYLDADWYRRIGRERERNLSLEAWNRAMDALQIFDVRDWEELLRAQRIADEFHQTYIYRGSGDEYRRQAEIKAVGAPLILPLTFPEATEIRTPFEAMELSLEELKHWEWAPANPAVMDRAGVTFALTMDGIDKPGDFWQAVRKAIRYGLPENKALDALTIIPAQLLGAGKEIGSLETGKRADFIITSGSLFDRETVIHETWIDGRPYIDQAPGEPDLDGKYDLRIGTTTLPLTIRGGKPRNEASLRVDTVNVDVQLTWDQDRIHLRWDQPDSSGAWFLTGYRQKGHWSGRGTGPDGQWALWTADLRDTIRTRDRPERNEPDIDPDSLGPVTYPFLPYGWTIPPATGTWLIRGATVWTNTGEGILPKGDVLIADGKIVEVGINLPAGGAAIIDGRGKHVTPGIIDEHSHIAISRGVNECTQENTAEVRIGDVVNSEDINIYRQLAGGVTTSQLLHGSCNPVGGQSAIIKLRWGSTPEAMKFEGAPGFIKFALGENVKRSNNDRRNTRYPNTRMGVEQVYVNAFQKAREYERLNKDPGRRDGLRRDLETETMLEILNSQRFVTCHSYVQSEINMLMHVAEEFGFHINTFTHILEGYKVADKMARHGAGGSSFSDWWAYKFEVYDAIPYNGALMHSQGVVTAFNSDDPEMARRLNQEAAKAVRYGGVSEEDALKFVTLNPAKLLHIDDRVGSLAPGMDADLVLWSGHPLSVYSRPVITWVDGIQRYSQAEDERLRDGIRKERQRLIDKMKADDGEKKRRPERRPERHYHCDSVFDEITD